MKQKFTIDRNTWYRGYGCTGSFLLRDDGKMCCLGQIGQQCGAIENELLGVTSPQRSLGIKKFPDFLINDSTKLNSNICTELMNINDHSSSSDEAREKSIKEIFAAEGYEVEFIN